MSKNPSYFRGDNLPVEQVSWNEVLDYLRQLNSIKGKEYRLPTEAEWEYVARGGKSSKGYVFSGSNSLVDIDWYYDNSISKTHIVGQKQPNEIEIYDMSGNVNEWCKDWYGVYNTESQSNPQGVSNGTFRIYRGGSWFTKERYCGDTHRSYNNPDRRDCGIGFRIVCIK